MNILKITKGSDVRLFVNNTELYFVVDFYAKESEDVYEIKEFLSDECVDVVKGKKDYTITICALSILSSTVFEKEPFSFTVVCPESVFEYEDCVVKSKERVIDKNNPLTDKYTIKAKNMRVIHNEEN